MDGSNPVRIPSVLNLLGNSLLKACRGTVSNLYFKGASPFLAILDRRWMVVKATITESIMMSEMLIF